MGFLGRFPSSQELWTHTVNAGKRFPLSLLCAALGTLAAVALAEDLSDSTQSLYQRLLITAALGLPLFVALTVCPERRGWSVAARLGVQGAALALLAVYFFTLPADIVLVRSTMVRFLALAVVVHSFVAFRPYLGKDEVPQFWQFNKTLFVRFLIAALYSAVLYVGLVIALAAADHLFGMDVKEQRYAQLWFIMTGLAHPWIFLAGVPRDLNEEVAPENYPKGLRIFAQFILLPLAALYFVILIAFETKILVTWSWPDGWVTNLVLWYSVVGILSFLLLHPLARLQENAWIRKLGRLLFYGLIPLVFMLFLAIFRRISDYGMTVNRYFVVALAVGLAFVVLYFIFSRKRDIRVIPIVLFVIGLLSAYGPQSAFSVAERAQLGRLEALLEQYGLPADEGETVGSVKVPFEDRKKMSAAVGYLSDWFGAAAFEGLIDEESRLTADTVSRWERSKFLADAVGFAYVGPYAGEESETRFQFGAEDRGGRSVRGYDYLVEYNRWDRSDSARLYALGGDSLYVWLVDRGGPNLLVWFGAGQKPTDTGMLSLTEFVRGLTVSGEQFGMNADSLAAQVEAESFRARVEFTRIAGDDHGDSLVVDNVNCAVLIEKR